MIGVFAVIVFLLLVAPAYAVPLLHSDGGREARDGAARMVRPEDMDEVRDGCQRWLADTLGMRLAMPLKFKYETLERIRCESGSSSAVGYTEFVTRDGKVSATVHIPISRRLDQTVHAFTHELTHVWLRERGAAVDEGLCEWAAWHDLESRGFTAEMDVIERNVVDGYAAAFQRVQSISARRGRRETVEQFAKSAR